MLRKLIPLVLALAGLGAGVGAGVLLRPEPANKDPAAIACLDGAEAPHLAKPDLPPGDDDGGGERDYVKLNNQFVVPVVADGRVTSLVVLALSLEVESGQTEPIYEREPKLRDALLQVMFDHANTGGFDGAFTQTGALTALRVALREAAQRVAGKMVRDVLIMDIVRQDT